MLSFILSFQFVVLLHRTKHPLSYLTVGARPSSTFHNWRQLSTFNFQLSRLLFGTIGLRSDSPPSALVTPNLKCPILNTTLTFKKSCSPYLLSNYSSCLQYSGQGPFSALRPG